MRPGKERTLANPPRAEWQIFFEGLIEKKYDRERVADHFAIDEWSPRRWARGISKPREKHIRELPSLFPERREELTRLLRIEYPHLFPKEESHVKGPSEIPPGYYDQLLEYLSMKSDHGNEPFFYLGLSNLASQLSLPGETWVYLLSLSATRRSLYTVAHACYENPYQPDIHHHFLWINSLIWTGCESVAGQAVMSKQPVLTRREAAYPFLRRSHVAGCLWIVQQPEGPGWSEEANSLLQQYARLISTAFLDTDYTAHVELENLPSLEAQKRVLASYRLQVISPSLLLEAENALVKGASRAPK